MIKSFKKKLKEQKGFTLIELLAVIVILGIIAAIAIPSILGLIQNSKDDAQVANAQQLISAARNAVSQNDVGTWTAGTPATTSVTLEALISQGYLENNIKNPEDKLAYDQSGSKVDITKDTSGTTTKFTYKVTLKKDGTGATPYFSAIDANALTRQAVVH